MCSESGDLSINHQNLANNAEANGVHPNRTHLLAAFAKLFDHDHLSLMRPTEVESHTGNNYGNDPNYPFYVNAYNYMGNGQQLRVVFSEKLYPVDENYPSGLKKLKTTYSMRMCTETPDKFEIGRIDPVYDFFLEFRIVGTDIHILQAFWDYPTNKSQTPPTDLFSFLKGNNGFINVTSPEIIPDEDPFFLPAVTQTLQIAVDFMQDLNTIQGTASAASKKALRSTFRDFFAK